MPELQERSEIPRLILTKLKPGSEYKIWIVAKTKSSNVSKSESVHAKTFPWPNLVSWTNCVGLVIVILKTGGFGLGFFELCQNLPLNLSFIVLLKNIL